jgi:DNA helicase HerA-like ATPase
MLQLAAGAFVLRKLYKDMFTWGEADRLRLLVVLDEAHRLAQDKTLPKLMKEGRKFGIGVLVASQSLGDFHEDVRNNVGAKVVFRTNYPESSRVAGFISAPPSVNLLTPARRSKSGADMVHRQSEQGTAAVGRLARVAAAPGGRDA